MTNSNNRLQTYKNACRRGMDWVLQFRRGDGAIGPVEDRLFYYRVPWTCALMGENEAAGAKLEWIKKNMFTSEGAFSGISPQTIYDDRYGAYPLSCLISGALIHQRPDIVYPGIRYLQLWQGENGGVYNRIDTQENKDEQEIFPTAQFGMTMIQAGKKDAAIAAGKWLEHLWNIQPDIDTRLYHVFSSEDQNIVTDIKEEEEPLYITKKDQPWQHHFNGGIAAAFLTNLYLATSDPKWLETASAYQDFSMTTDDVQFRSKQVCKSGWGSGLLYIATREKKYRDWTIRMGDWFLENQCADGHWENTPYWNPQPTVADNIEITTEFIMHLSHIISYLATE